MTTLKTIIAYELVDHGIEHEQYFQGCGLSFTPYTDVVTGIGSSLREALEDAAEQLATQGFDLPPTLDDEIQQVSGAVQTDETKHTDCGDDECFAADCHYYASIRVKEDKP